MRRAEVERRRRAWQRAMQQVADALGKDDPAVKGMGSVAWGRYEGEPTVTDNLVNAAVGWGYLQGVRDALLHTARDQRWHNAERELARIHDRMEL